jgi:uncharacterized iron-regulated membrane protein
MDLNADPIATRRAMSVPDLGLERRPILRLRPFLVLVHRVTGLTIAGFLILAGLTGAVISWDHELDAWLNPHLFEAPGRGATKTPFALAKGVELADPKAWATYYSMKVSEGKSFKIFVEPRPDLAEGGLLELSYNQIFIDPVSGETLGRREWGALRFDREHLVPLLYALHFSLCIPEFWGIESWGIWLMGGIAILWVVDCFIGFLVTLPGRERNASQTPVAHWWRRWKPAWRVKWAGTPYRINFDLHRALGLWLWLVLFILSVSAVALNLEREVVRPFVGLFASFTPSPEDERQPVPNDKPIIPKLSFAEIAERAQAEADRRGIREPLGALGYLQQFGFYRADFFGSEDARGAPGFGPAMIDLDGTDGRILSERIPGQGTAGDLFLQLQFPLHSGRIAGLPGRIFISFMGLVVAALAATGLVIWWRKRKARTKVGHRRQP